MLRIVVAAPGVDLLDGSGQTALHIAATWPLGHPDVLTMFDHLVASSTAAGLDINQRTTHGETALHLAICCGSGAARRGGLLRQGQT